MSPGLGRGNMTPRVREWEHALGGQVRLEINALLIKD